ncbi:MAG: hypothetical protein AAF236_16365 [Verrucomicrobiota bacterium]
MKTCVINVVVSDPYQLWKNHLAVSPGDWGVRLKFAEELHRTGQPDAAAATIHEGVGPLPSESDLRRALGLVGGQVSHPAWEGVLSAHLRSNPTSSLAHRVMAARRLGEQSHGEAWVHYREAVRLNPDLRDVGFEQSLGPEAVAPKIPPSGPQPVGPERSVPTPVAPERGTSPERPAVSPVAAEAKSTPAPVPVAPEPVAPESVAAESFNPEPFASELVSPEPVAPEPFSPEAVASEAPESLPSETEVVEEKFGEEPEDENFEVDKSEAEPAAVESETRGEMASTSDELDRKHREPEPARDSAEAKIGSAPVGYERVGRMLCQTKRESKPLEFSAGESTSAPEVKLVIDEEKALSESTSVLHLSTLPGVISVAEIEDDKRERLSALIAGVAIHVLLIAILAIWFVAELPPPPPQITTRAPVKQQERPPKRPKIDPAEASASSLSGTPAPVVSANNFSAMVTPTLTLSDTPALLGVVNPLGSSLSLGGAGGSVSFFGSQSDARKVVFVVDVSASMQMRGKEGKTRFSLMKEELKRSVGSLPPGINYHVLFFSGPAWFAGTELDRENWSDGGTNIWQYKDGRDDQLPTARFLRATPPQIRATLEAIEDVPMVYGTDWRSPLKMAIKMKPDLIYFMTDGAVDGDAGPRPVVEDVLDFNRRNAGTRINCIILMEPKATDLMEQLARGTRGELSLVREDGRVVRGAGAVSREVNSR